MQNDSRRGNLFKSLLEEKTSYLQHYEYLLMKYPSVKDILIESRNVIREKIMKLASDGHYKYQIYVEMNPNLDISPFLNELHPIVKDIIKFRLGCHYLPIETGRWCRIPRVDRFCSNCYELGDEKHIIYRCSLIQRSDVVLSPNLCDIWGQPEIYTLMKRIKLCKFL